MKKVITIVCIAVAAFAALAEDALPPFKLAGFALGEKVDAATCSARGLSVPEKVVVDKDGTICYRCKTAAPTGGFDEVRLVLSSESKVISITGVLRPGDKAVCERNAKELAAKYKAELAARESAAGTMVLEVNYGTDVEVVLASVATKPLADKATADGW